MRDKSSWITRTFATRSEFPMLTVWETLVIPLHDYCSQLWCPSLIKDIELLESIQWMYIRKINFVPPNYWDALKELNLYSLQGHKERYQIFLSMENIRRCCAFTKRQ